MLIKVTLKSTKQPIVLNDSFIIAISPLEEGCMIVHKSLEKSGYNARREHEVVESLEVVFAMSRFKET